MPVCRMDPDNDWLQSTMALIQWSNGRDLLEDSLTSAQMLHDLRDFDWESFFEKHGIQSIDV